MNKQIALLIFLIVLLFVIDYPFLDSALKDFLEDSETGIVERVIDGDTIAVNNYSIRLLGINCPERGEKYYQEAKEFLEKVILGKEVELRFGREKYDKYDRKLAYVFYKNANVNLELVDEGYANFYFPSGKDRYYDKFVRNWEHCIVNNKYLCEKSEDECADCVELRDLDYENQEVVFYNKCDFDCDLKDWAIKDEGRKKFVFQDFVLAKNKEVKIIVGDGVDNGSVLVWKKEDYVWTSTGDTLFLRDDEGKLVLWKGY